MTDSNPPLDGTLRSLTKSGQPPESRLSNASEARIVVENYIRADEEHRSWKRSRVAGLVGGNPPYDAGAQRKAGRGKNANANFGVARSYLEAALSAFYDIFSEASTYATVKTYYGESSDQIQEWSGIQTEEFHKLQTDENSFDYDMQLSQHDMVLYGAGPMMFYDTLDYRAQAVRCGNLLVPEHAKSNTHRWEVCSILQDLLPHELYGYIRSEESSYRMGWNVPFTRKSIQYVRVKNDSGLANRNWEWHQQNLKNGSFYYSSQSKIIRVAHIFFKEFPTDLNPEGAISHKIILRDAMESTEEEFLFEHVGRFENWNQCIHPMYYDHGGGGEHHSVTGMGIKLYSAMELQNRLLCNLADKAFSPKLLFRPTTAANKQKMSIVQYGEYGIMSPDFELMQTQVAGFMQDGIGFNRELSGIVASNMSQYRQNLQKETGNPMTASESNWRASEQSKLGKTQLNRYYDQLDYLYADKFRRASNPGLNKGNPGGSEALEFQKRCRERGVPAQAMKDVCVRASRIAGSGSVYERQQGLEFLLGLIGMLPETGRDNLLRMVVAGRAGQSQVESIYPKSVQSERPTDQHVIAMLQVSSMKDGIAPVVSPTQNAAIFAQTFLLAGAQSLESLQNGADPAEVLMFLELVGPAIGAHIQRLSQDPSRKQIVKALTEQFKQLAKNTDDLKAFVEQQQQARDEQQQEMQQAQQRAGAIRNGTDPDTLIKQAELEHKLKLDDIKARAGLQHKDAKARQSAMAAAQKLTISDLSAAAKLRIQKEQADSKSNGE